MPDDFDSLLSQHRKTAKAGDDFDQMLKQHSRPTQGSALTGFKNPITGYSGEEPSWFDQTVGSAAYGAADMGGLLSRKIGSWIPGQDFFDNVGTDLQDWMNRNPQYAPMEVESAWDLITNPKALVGRVSSGIPYLATLVGGSALGPWGAAAAFGTVGLIEYQRGYESAIADGQDDETASKKGIANSVIQTALNLIPLHRWAKVASGANPSIAKALLSRALTAAERMEGITRTKLTADAMKFVTIQTLVGTLGGSTDDLISLGLYGKPLPKDMWDRVFQNLITAGVNAEMVGYAFAKGHEVFGKDNPVKSLIDFLRPEQNDFSTVTQLKNTAKEVFGADEHFADAYASMAYSLAGPLAERLGISHEQALGRLIGADEGNPLKQITYTPEQVLESVKKVKGGIEKVQGSATKPLTGVELAQQLYANGVDIADLRRAGLGDLQNSHNPVTADKLKQAVYNRASQISTVNQGAEFAKEVSGRIGVFDQQLDLMQGELQKLTKPEDEGSRQAIMENMGKVQKLHEDTFTQQFNVPDEKSGYKTILFDAPGKAGKSEPVKLSYKLTDPIEGQSGLIRHFVINDISSSDGKALRLAIATAMDAGATRIAVDASDGRSKNVTKLLETAQKLDKENGWIRTVVDGDEVVALNLTNKAKTKLFEGLAKDNVLLHRGSLRLLQDGKAVIDAVKGNPTSLMEQLFSIFKKQMPDEDKDILGDYVGEKDEKKWTPQHDEKVFRAWNRYLKDGKAPNANMGGLFLYFKNFATKVWARTKLMGEDFKVPDQVRGVFDRMFVKDAEPVTAKRMEIQELARREAELKVKLMQGEKGETGKVEEPKVGDSSKVVQAHRPVKTNVEQVTEAALHKRVPAFKTRDGKIWSDPTANSHADILNHLMDSMDSDNAELIELFADEGYIVQSGRVENGKFVDEYGGNEPTVLDQKSLYVHSVDQLGGNTAKAVTGGNKSEVKAKVKPSARLLKLTGENMYNNEISSVIVKELVQNAVDAVRAHPRFKDGTGQIDVDVDVKTKVISVRDNGVGMLPDTIATAFLDPGESLKPNGASGGLGMAKIALLGSSASKADSPPMLKRQFRLREYGASKRERLAFANDPEFRVNVDERTVSEDSFEYKNYYGPEASESNKYFAAHYMELQELPAEAPPAPIHVVSVAKDGEGVYWRSTLDMDSDEWYDSVTTGSELTIKKERLGKKLPDGVDTGTVVQIRVADNKKFSDYNAREFIGSLQRRSLLPIKFKRFQGGREDYQEPSLNEQSKQDNLPELRKLATIPLTHGSADIYIRENPQDRSSLTYDVLNNGLYQFNTYKYMTESQPLPDAILVDVRASAKPDEPGYPFRLDREGLKDVDARIVDDWLMQNLVKQLAKEKHKKFFDTLKEATYLPTDQADPTQFRHMLVDTSGSVKNETLANWAKGYPYITKLSLAAEAAFDKVTSVLTRYSGNPRYSGGRFAGLSVSRDYYGVNLKGVGVFGKEGSPNLVLFNPWVTARQAESVAMKLGSASDVVDIAAAQTASTLIHEAVHQVSWSHDESYSSNLTNALAATVPVMQELITVLRPAWKAAFEGNAVILHEGEIYATKQNPDLFRTISSSSSTTPEGSSNAPDGAQPSTEGGSKSSGDIQAGSKSNAKGLGRSTKVGGGSADGGKPPTGGEGTQEAGGAGGDEWRKLNEEHGAVKRELDAARESLAGMQAQRVDGRLPSEVERLTDFWGDVPLSVETPEQSWFRRTISETITGMKGWAVRQAEDLTRTLGGGKLLEALDQMRTEQRMFASQVEARRVEVLNQLTRQERQMIARDVDGSGFSLHHRFVDPMSVPEGQRITGPLTKGLAAYKEFYREVFELSTQKGIELRMLRRGRSGTLEPLKQSKNPSAPRMLTMAGYELLRGKSGEAYSALMAKILELNPDVSFDKITTDLDRTFGLAQSQERDFGALEHVRGIKYMPDFVYLKDGSTVQVMHSEPIETTIRVIDRYGQRLGWVKWIGQGMLRDVKEPALVELINALGYSTLKGKVVMNEFGKLAADTLRLENDGDGRPTVKKSNEFITDQLEQHGIEDFGGMTQKELLALAKEFDVPTELTRDDIVDVIKKFNPSKIDKKQYVALKKVAKSIEGIEIKETNPQKLFADIMERIETHYDEYLVDKLRRLHAQGGGSIKTFNDIVAMGQGIPLWTQQQTSVAKLGRLGASVIGSMQTSLAAIPNMPQTFTQVARFTGLDNLLKAHYRVMQHPDLALSDLQAIAGLREAVAVYCREPGPGLDEFSRIIRQGVGQATGQMKMTNLNNLISGTAFLLKARYWREHGITTKDASLLKSLRLTDGEISEIRNKRMSDRTFGKIVQQGIATTQYLTEAPWMKSKIENHPLTAALLNYMSYATGTARNMLSVVDAFKTKDPAKLLGAMQGASYVLIGLYGAGVVSGILRQAAKGDFRQLRDEEGDMDRFKSAMLEAGLYGPVQRAFTPFNFDGGQTEKGMVGMMPHVSALVDLFNAAIGRGKFGDFLPGRRLTEAFVKNTPIAKGFVNWFDKTAYPEKVTYDAIRSDVNKFQEKVLGKENRFLSTQYNPEYFPIWEMAVRGNKEEAIELRNKFVQNSIGQGKFIDEELSRLRQSLIARAPIALSNDKRHHNLLKFIMSLPEEKKMTYLRAQMDYMGTVNMLVPRGN